MRKRASTPRLLLATLVTVALAAVVFTLQTVSQPSRSAVAANPNQNATPAPTEPPPAPTEAPPAPTEPPPAPTEAPPAPTEPPPAPTTAPPAPTVAPTSAPIQPTARPTDVPQVAPAQPTAPAATPTTLAPTAEATTTPARVRTAATASVPGDVQVLMPVTGGDGTSDMGIWIGIVCITAASAMVWRRRRNGK